MHKRSGGRGAVELHENLMRKENIPSSMEEKKSEKRVQFHE